MEETKAASVVLRPKRQVTLPRKVCEQMGIEPGDRLELFLEGCTLVARPKKIAALEALQEIREAFKRSGITAEELQKTGRGIRREITAKRYAART